MTQNLLDVRGVTRRFDGLSAVDQVDLSIAAGPINARSSSAIAPSTGQPARVARSRE
jgi:ABC-type uncharacterized transport system ATPase subunit